MRKILIAIAGLVMLTSFNNYNDVSFEAKFEIKENRLVVQSTKGFTFNLMAFTKKKDVYFNQSGMVNMKVKNEIENSDFIFKINRQKNKITLEGIKNTNWKTLEFKNIAIVDQNGILK